MFDVAEWAGKFGGEYARRIGRMSKGRFAVGTAMGAVIFIEDTKHWLWRAVDADGYVLRPLCKAGATGKPRCGGCENDLRSACQS